MGKLKVMAVMLIVVLVGAGNLYAEDAKTPRDAADARGTTRGAQPVEDAQKPGGLASLAIYSDYLWRGIRLSDGIVLQPSVSTKYKGFGATVWANWDEKQNEMTETDALVNYTYDMNRYKLTAGYIYYSWRFKTGQPAGNLPGHTQEIFASVGYDAPLVSPKLTLYLDIENGDGAFLLLTLGRSFDMSKDMPFFGFPKGASVYVGGAASVNFGNKVVGGGDRFTNFHNGEIWVAGNLPLGANVALEPKIGYSFPLSDDAKDALHRVSFSRDDNKFYAGGTLTFRF